MHQAVCSCGEHWCAAEGGGYYVTALDGARVGYLLGPYATHEAALADVDLGRRLAERVDLRAAWYAYGTARKPDGPFSAGKLNDLAAASRVEST